MMSVIPSFDACPAVTVSDFRNNAYQKVHHSQLMCIKVRIIRRFRNIRT
ncbi:hypothetical protein UUU_19500 [Klebsiella pneumoniae subsp. pneumoniae DSM 30104 = JCM 1662 = NBRC 14940]|nr:hypothetical protein UUU_19500 [Klebsiella pneumoniae subsp. pneumoniae DSM 30104 = JCM 1662 = NBRC 14940]